VSGTAACGGVQEELQKRAPGQIEVPQGSLDVQEERRKAEERQRWHGTWDDPPRLN
jgi:hypothetical protein